MMMYWWFVFFYNIVCFMVVFYHHEALCAVKNHDGWLEDEKMRLSPKRVMSQRAVA